MRLVSFVGVRLGSTLLSCILAPAISKHSYGGMIFFCLFVFATIAFQGPHACFMGVLGQYSDSNPIEILECQ